MFHQATIAAAVLDSTGKVVMEAILATNGDHSRLYPRSARQLACDLRRRHLPCSSPNVTQVLDCDPRKNALLKVGNKSDRIDARKLAELLRSNLLRSVYHEDTGLRTVALTGN